MTDIIIQRNPRGYKQLKDTLLALYGSDMEVYDNMNIYTHVWATEIIDGQVDNGFHAETFEEWFSKLIEVLVEEGDNYIAFFDHVKYDEADIGRKVLKVHIEF